MWIPAGLWLCSPGSLVVSSEGARQIKHVELVSVDTLHFARLTPTAESQREERRCDCTRQRNTGETQTEHKFGFSCTLPSVVQVPPLLPPILPVLERSLTDEPLSVQAASLSLPRLRSDMGLKSSLLSGWGLEDMGIPYRKFERTELVEVAGVDDVTTWAVVFTGQWLLCIMTAVEEL